MQKIERLDRTRHDRQSFDCGRADLNAFLQQRAAKNAQLGVSTTYVVVDDTAQLPRPILGYYALTTCQFPRDDLPAEFTKGLPNTISAPLLAKLGVHLDGQRSGIGKQLIADILLKITEARTLVGGTGLIVDAKDAESRAYYENLGFQRLGPESLRLYLPKATIDAALDKSACDRPASAEILHAKIRDFIPGVLPDAP